MKLAKSLLLGSAAALAATAGAQAADLPFRKAAPVDYVRVCDWTGAGYFYIPGTDTCLKIGGFVRAEYEFLSPGKAFIPGVPTQASATAGAGNALTNGHLITARSRDESGFFIRGRIDADARTQTAYGTLRTYVRYQIDRYTGAENSGGFSGTAGGGNPAGGSNSAYLDKGFIQFAGITAGRVQSAFDFGADPYGFEGIATTDESTESLQYTATFGGGFSATISLEDPNVRRSGIGETFTGLTAAGLETGLTSAAYSGNRVPDVVGALRVDQAWGSAQLSGAYHQVNATDGVGNSTDGDGFAVRGGVLFKLPMLAAGDEFQVEGGYSSGAYQYQDSNGMSTGYSGNVTVGGLFHANNDAIAIATPTGGFTLAKAEGFSVSGGFVHYFTPNFNNIIFGSYQEVGYGKTAKAYSWINGGVGEATSYRVADQFNWFPVKDMQIGVEVMYIKVNQKVPGVTADGTIGAGAGTPLPTGIKANPDAFETRLRLERDF